MGMKRKQHSASTTIFKSGNVKAISPAPALAYSSPVAAQTTGTTALLRKV